MSAGGGRRRGPAVLDTLSTSPESLWPDAIFFHGTRVLLLGVVAVVITALFPPVTTMTAARYEVGMVADQDLLATVPFDVPKSQEELERDRELAAAAVPPTLDYRPEAVDSMAARVERFFDAVDSAAAAGGAPAVESYLNRVSIRPQPAQLQLLVDEASRARLRDAALAAVNQILRGGVFDNEEDITTDRVAIRIDGQDGGFLDRARLMSQPEFLAAAEAELGDDASPDAANLLRLILIRWQEYNYTLNVLATELDRNQAREAVDVTRSRVVEGEAIVRANTQIRETEIERLNAYEAELRDRGLIEEQGVAVLPFVGSTLIAVLLLGVYGLLVFLFRKEIYGNYMWILLQALLVTAYFVAGAVIHRNGFASELLPIAFVALSVAVLWDGRMALVLVLMLALLTATLPPFGTVQVAVTVAAGGAAAALSVRAVQSRAQTWAFIAIITAAYAAMILANGLVADHAPVAMARAVAWSAGNATASAILAMGFMPVFEWMTGITTHQTLLEWADPNRTLLKRLSMEAPGTHAHSIQVANLCEAGAAVIGADGLLCRVGAYYHDIGKVLKPQYFIENQPDGRNPHDKLKPLTSAQIVREHVTEGLRLAREEKVPDAIADFIPQHHGDQRITYFYQKAVDDAGGEAVDPGPFTYPGPRPKSRETAVCMLADSVESATRVLKDATPERIRDLVHNIIDAKVQEGQLSETDLTLREISLLEDQFVKILSGMYHHRIDYPTTRHLTESPAATPPSDAGPASGATTPEAASPESGSPGTSGDVSPDGPSAPEAAGPVGEEAADTGPADRAEGRDRRGPAHDDAPTLPGLD